MIKVVTDIDNLIKPDKKGLTFAQFEDYVNGYQPLIQAIENSLDLIVYIQNPTIENWIKRMASRYPQGTFLFEEMDARKYLQKLWNITTPDYITNEDVNKSEILEAEITPRSGDTFEDIIVGHYYDPIFTSSVFPTLKLVDVIFAYDESKWENNAANHLVYRVYQNRFDGWRNKTKDRAILSILDKVEESIPQLKIQLMKFKVLRSYPKLGRKLLCDSFKDFNSLKLNLHNLDIDEAAINNVIEQIEYYLNDLMLPVDEEEIFLYISKLSGLLILEFDKVETLLRNNTKLITTKIIGEISAVFNPIINRIQKRIEKLKSLIQPSIPESPDPSWSFEKMLDWATNSYLPYFTWADLNDFIDEEILKKSDQFAQFIYNNWEEIRTHSKHLVYNILPNNSAKLQSQKDINLVIIIDGLGWRYTSILKNYFQNIGFETVETEPYLSMLPSTTEISKKCLLSGVPTYNEIDDKKYNAIVEKGWVPFFNDSKFKYIPDIDKLSEISKIEHGTYIVNYLPIDRILHQSESDLGLPHNEHINSLLEKLIEKVTDFINRHNLLDKIVIHITSDHGATRIPKNIKNEIDVNYFKDKDFDKLSHRFLTVDPERFNRLPENLKEDCFFLEQEKFGNNQNFLCARRSNRFLKIKDNHYVHGGLSPEEMVVPYIAFQKITTPIKNLKIQLDKTDYRYRLEIIELEIANPNEYPIENVNIEILNGNIESDLFILDWLDAKRKTTISIQSRFKKTLLQEDVENLTFSISYKCNEKTKRHQVTLPIKMKSMFEMKDKTIFDDFD